MAIQVTEQEMELILKDAIDALFIPHFMALGMNASGQWKNNVEARGNTIWGMDYTEYLANGRSPNSNQSPEALKAWVGWAGSTIIAQWVKDKGLNLNPYAVAQNIARKGTTWKQKGGSDLLEFLNSKPFLDFIQNRIVEKLGENIRSKLYIDTKLAFTR